MRILAHTTQCGGASIAVKLKMNYGKTRIEYLVDFNTKYTSIPASNIVDIKADTVKSETCK